MSEITKNKKSYYHFEIIESIEAGVVLKGTEIKSIRAQSCSIEEAYVKIISGELWLIGAFINPYAFGNIHNHEAKRDRKLLVHKKEMQKLQRATQEKGLTIVPLKVYWKNGKAKVLIASARGKKTTDKRKTIQDRQDKRRVERAIKNASH